MGRLSKAAAIFLALLCTGSGAIASEMVDRHIFSPGEEQGKEEEKGLSESPKAKELKKLLDFTGVVIAADVKYAMIKPRRVKRGEEVGSLHSEGDEISEMVIKEIGSNYLILSDKSGEVRLSLYQGDKPRPAAPPEPRPEPEEKEAEEKEAEEKETAGVKGEEASGNGAAPGAKATDEKTPPVIKPAAKKTPGAKTDSKAGPKKPATTSNPFLDAMRKAREEGAGGSASSGPSSNPFLDAIRRAKGN